MTETMMTSTSADEARFDRYVRIPPNGRVCPWTGLGHAKLYQLLDMLAENHVRVAHLREPGAKRGVRLYHVGDMLSYLDRLAQTQREERRHPAGGEAA